MVLRMSDNSADPSGNTEAFRAFTERAATEPAAASSSKTPFIVGGIVAAVVLIGLIIYLAN